MTNNQNEWESITTDFADIKRIRRNYKQLYCNTFGNLDEIEILFERHKLLNITQEEIDKS